MIGTRVAIACFMIATACGIWIGGIKLQWWLGLRNLPQMIVMLVLMALPALIAPPLAKGVLPMLRPDAALLSPRARLWFGVVSLLVWAGVALLLMIGINERLAMWIPLGGLVVGAFLSTYASAPRPPIESTRDRTG